MTRAFVSIFTAHNGPSIRGVAMSACDAGYAVVPVAPGGRNPICTLTTRERAAERKAGTRHDCGVHHAITDSALAGRVFARLTKEYGTELNIGIVAGPSRVIQVDCDIPEEVTSFLNAWAAAENDPGYLAHTPTVRTPGKQLPDGTWVHKDGGHFYFEVPAGVDLDYEVIGTLVAPVGGYLVKWGNTQCVAPPSVRPEGSYEATGNISEAPEFLVQMIQDKITEITAYRTRAREFFPNDTIADWSMATPWDTLLEPHGWTSCDKPDSCGCMTWTKPGGGTSSDKSATAHDAGCTFSELAEGHGALHLWTTDPPAELAAWGGRSMTKLQFVAAMEYGGDVDAAKLGLGLVKDLTEWFEELPEAEEPEPEEPGPIKKAALDALASAGLGPEKADELASSLLAYIPKGMAQLAFDHLTGRAKPPDKGLSWQADPVALLADWDVAEASPAPTLLEMSDGRGIFYRDKPNGLIGPTSSGKTWLAILATISALEQGLKVYYADMEDTLGEFKGRIIELGMVDTLRTAVADRRLVYANPGLLPMADINPTLDYLAGFDFAVFDVLNRLLSRVGGDVNSGNTEILWLYDNLFSPLAGRGTGSLLLDHPNRANSGPHADPMAGAGGGGQKENAMSGHSVSMKVVTPFSKQNPAGEVDLYTLKDRGGHFTKGVRFGRLKGSMFTVDGEIGLGMAVEAIDPATQVTPTQEAKEGVLKLLEAEPSGRLAKALVKERLSSRLRKVFVDAVVELELEGRLTQTMEKSGKTWLVQTPAGPTPGQAGPTGP